MSLILNIDTSTEKACISLAENAIVLKSLTNPHQKDHSAFLHTAIRQIFVDLSLGFNSVDAIAVVNGPGSYTGLRVGMASAKGLCFALNKPLITVSSLEALAKLAIDNETSLPQSAFICPMIDARRMEVFTALFDMKMNQVMEPKAMILDKQSFDEKLKTNKICFLGDGSRKFQEIQSNFNAVYTHFWDITESVANLSFQKYIKNNFTHLIDSEPLYIKDFHISPDLHNKKQGTH